MLVSWGANGHGQLGNGSQDDTSSPTKCCPLSRSTKIRSISGGGGHTVILTDDGGLLACGLNNHGQLGLCEQRASCCGVSAVDADGLAHSVAKASRCCEQPATYKCTSQNHQQAQCFASGAAASSVQSELTVEHSSGSVYLQWAHVCLPKSLSSSRVRHMACGWNHTLACTESGEVLAWGCNTYGQLGAPPAASATTRAQATAAEASAVSSAGPCSAASSSEASPANAGGKYLVPGLPAVVSVACGLRHSVALDGDGRVWTWGHNRRSQLGRHVAGTTVISSTPQLVEGLERVARVAAGAYHNVALTEDGHVYCWGSNNFGQCGSTLANGKVAATPKRILMDCLVECRPVIVSAGWTHCAAVTSSGQVLTWGRSHYGQLGLGDQVAAAGFSDEPAVIPDIPHIKQLTCGSEHTLALTVDGGVLTWGWNDHGMCGNETDVDVKSPIAVHLACGGVSPTLIGCGAGHCVIYAAS